MNNQITKPVTDAPNFHEVEVKPDDILFPPAYSALFDLETDNTALWRIRDSLHRNPTQTTPVEIVADGTLLAGDDYVTAARQEPLDTIRVIAWDDLSGLGAEARMIASGLRRHGLGPMAQARCVRRALEIGPDLPRHMQRDIPYHSDLFAALEQRLAIDSRTARRYMWALQAPREIQRALDAKEIRLAEAEAVGHLPDESQADIVAAIQGGAPAKEAIQPHLEKQKKHRAQKPQDPRKLITRLVSRLQLLLPQFEGVRPRLRFMSKEHVAVLTEATRVFKELQTDIDILDPDSPAAIERATFEHTRFLVFEQK